MPVKSSNSSCRRMSCSTATGRSTRPKDTMTPCLRFNEGNRKRRSKNEENRQRRLRNEERRIYQVDVVRRSGRNGASQKWQPDRMYSGLLVSKPPPAPFISAFHIFPHPHPHPHSHCKPSAMAPLKIWSMLSQEPRRRIMTDG